MTGLPTATVAFPGSQATASTVDELAFAVVVCCCSLKRHADLREAIDSLLGQVGADDEIVVVVDHNPDLLALVRADYPELHVVANDGPRGLSAARNAGIAATSRPFVAFLDDDAVAAPRMLDAMREAFASSPHVAGVAGHVVPHWLDRQPSWFPPEFLWVVGCTYEGLRPGPVRNPIGACMALRRTVFDTVGGFASGIGRGEGRLPLGCEETELCIRAARSIDGAVFLYTEEASCRHKVPASRGTWRYLVARCYAEGLSKAALAGLSVSSRGLTTERAYVGKTLPAAVRNGLRDGLVRADPSGFGRTFAVLLGLTCTVLGYGVGRLRFVSRPDQSRSGSVHAEHMQAAPGAK